MQKLGIRIITAGALAAAVSSFVGSAALAENLALLIGNKSYANTVDAKGAQTVFGIADALAEAGYRVQAAENTTQNDLRAVLTSFAGEAAAADRLIVVFTGHVLNNGTETFLAPTDLGNPKSTTIALQAPSLSSLLAIASEHAGGAGVFLGFHGGKSGFFGGQDAGFRGAEGLTPGLGRVDIPQGVLLVSGPPDKVVASLRSGFLQTDRTTAEAAANLPDDVRADGFVSRFSTLATGEQTAAPDRPAPVDTAQQREQRLWQIARETNTAEGYLRFLDQVPRGAFAELARIRIEELQTTEPDIDPAQQVEIDLALTRDQRRQVQRDLTILEHDPRGIDGLFGPASRRAITQWQTANRFQGSGYLNKRQNGLLRQQAQLRSDQLAEEAKRKAEAERTADIRFWNQTGANAEEADLRVYLRNYPDGIYSEEARAQLDVIERRRMEETQGPERTEWQVAENANTIAAYERYLDVYPRGLFAETAQQRIVDLKDEAANKSTLQAAQRNEKALGLNTSAWRLIESRLSKLGLKPGKVDGKPTKDTRRALRNYQKNAELPVTGYMDRATLSRLILTITF